MLQLSVSYAQKEQKWLHAPRLEIVTNEGSPNKFAVGWKKKIKKITSVRPVLCQSKQAYEILNLHDSSIGMLI